MKVFSFMLPTLWFGTVSIYSQAQTVQPLGYITPTPAYRGTGYKDTCLGCMAHWGANADTNTNDSGRVSWAKVRADCGVKGQCSGIAYMNAWSPIVIVHGVVTGPPTRWQKYRDANNKAVCLYTDPYFAGTEYCYVDKAFFKFSEELNKKISSFWAINLKKLRFGIVDNKVSGGVRWSEFDGNSEYDSGYNLLPKYNDQFTHIDFE